ncbi:MAG: type toxin-antitoxin system mRNA interferase toxin, RelE/StbE family [Gammaproteobacteria bacterium]|nr:type toxin-antitoxin system mRNA interferase toxin, RelE/StbE family [Gammaproteobacteria bacterium]
MAWTIEWRPSALKAFKNLDKSIQKKIFKFLNKRISLLENPRVIGKPLSYEKYGLWHYRIENFRIISRINDADMIILVIQNSPKKPN